MAKLAGMIIREPIVRAALRKQAALFERGARIERLADMRQRMPEPADLRAEQRASEKKAGGKAKH